MRTTSLGNRPRQEATSRRRWFEEDELTCAWLPCGKPMPAGYYGRQKRVYHCSHSCSQECYYARMRHLKCRHCGKTFVPRKSNSGKPFCSRDHASAWRQGQADKDRFGRFAPLVKEFLEDSKSRLLSRSSLKYLRSNLAAFFEFIPSKRIRSLENVRSSHITEFMEDRKLKAPKSGGRAAIDLHVFFDWMEKTKRRRAINPVIRRFHGWKPPRREPRPYTRMELARIRSLVEDDLQLKLAIEIGAESGLRISETCNLRMADVDLERQCFFIRLPTKTRTERFVPFHTRTRSALQAWFKVRPAADHDFVFVGRNNRPLRTHTLREHLNKVICGPENLAVFSYHALRHTASSAVYPAMDTKSVMRTFGWRSQSAMQGYTKVDPSSVRSSYVRAMTRLGGNDVQSAPQSQSIEAFFEGREAPK